MPMLQLYNVFETKWSVFQNIYNHVLVSERVTLDISNESHLVGAITLVSREYLYLVFGGIENFLYWL